MGRNDQAAVVSATSRSAGVRAAGGSGGVTRSALTAASIEESAAATLSAGSGIEPASAAGNAIAGTRSKSLVMSAPASVGSAVVRRWIGLTAFGEAYAAAAPADVMDVTKRTSSNEASRAVQTPR